MPDGLTAINLSISKSEIFCGLRICNWWNYKCDEWFENDEKRFYEKKYGNVIHIHGNYFVFYGIYYY